MSPSVAHVGAIGLGQLYIYVSLLISEVEIVRRKRDHVLGCSIVDSVLPDMSAEYVVLVLLFTRLSKS